MTIVVCMLLIVVMVLGVCLANYNKKKSMDPLD